VIEHFPEGYSDIAREMHRVLKRDGVLFLSFPAFNPYRKWRAAAGRYPSLSDHAQDMSQFYQFALDPQSVQSAFESLGFELIECRGTNSLVGLADESRLATAVMRLTERLDARGATALSKAMDLGIGRYVGHSCLLVLKKK
jgi:hypothetical protein